MHPIYQVIFEVFIPRITPEADKSLKYIGRWFGEEYFTYIRVFGSYAPPHILPLYVPYKLLAK